METDFLEIGRAILAQQPFSRLMGTQLTVFKSGQSELVVPIRPDMRQQNGFVHGGVVSYAADNALTFAGGSTLRAEVLTSEYKINYLRPARGDSLVARAWTVFVGKSQAVCRCDVFMIKEGKEVLCATAQGTVVRLSRPD